MHENTINQGEKECGVLFDSCAISVLHVGFAAAA
jgi:hypothetical protein